MAIECPHCGSRFLRPSRARNEDEEMLGWQLKTMLSCNDCKSRFVGPLFDWYAFIYASCPKCRRMDLNGWTGKTYHPPFWVALKVRLGARKLRCEYCRINFASFRRRKEVFTFKRWKRYVEPAERHPDKVDHGAEQ